MPVSLSVVAAVIANAEGAVLVAQRPLDKHQGGLWEFPGGKLEPGEAQFQALQRELEEELGIFVERAEFWLTVEHDYGDQQVRLHVWQVQHFRGEAYGREGQPLRWLKPEMLNQAEFPAANRAIISRLQTGV